MDSSTIAVYRKAISLYESFLEGKPVNIIDPDGSKPSKIRIRARLQQLKLAIS